MQIGRVAGTATSTVKHPSMEGCRLLVVQLLAADRQHHDGEPVLAVDRLGAGPGEEVVVSNDGKWTREMLKSDTTPVRWCVIALPDRERERNDE